MEKLIEFINIKKYFPIYSGVFRKVKGYVKALDGINFFIPRGTTLGIVGESGSGKTTIAYLALGLYKPTEGEIISYTNDIQAVFQNPFSSINPRMNVFSILSEPLITRKKMSREERKKYIPKLLEMVKLPSDSIYKYPHEFSGGELQRIAIARAISTSPEFIILDEPVSSLDVSVKAQILNLLKELQEKLNLTYMFISHDLSIVEFFSDIVLVLYKGKPMEMGLTEDVFSNPTHPYTIYLLETAKEVVKKEERRKEETNYVCPFYPRCSVSIEECKNKELPEKILNNKTIPHKIWCHAI